MPTFKQKIEKFINKYSKQNFSNKLNNLIESIKKSSENSGNSLWKLLMAIILIMLIFCQFFEIIVKNIIPHIRQLIQSVLAFLNECWIRVINLVEGIVNVFVEFVRMVHDIITNVLLVTIVSEIGFYFKMFKDSSQELKDSLTLVVQKLQDYSDFLSRKLENGNIEFKTKIPYSNINLLSKSFLYFFMFCFYLIIALIMSVLLLVGSVILLPVFHQYMREKFSVSI